MEIFKKWWFWLILIFILILLTHFEIKLINTKYCSEQDVGSYEYFDENYGVNVTGCPPRCTVSSCFGIKTACCPRGLEMLFEN